MNTDEIPIELKKAASGEVYNHEALLVAKEMPHITDEDRSVIYRFIACIQKPTDHKKLLAISDSIQEFLNANIPNKDVHP